MLDSSEPPDIAQLLHEINESFDGVSRDEGTTLHEAQAMDDLKSIAEQQLARRLDVDQRWQDVSDEALGSCDSALPYLDAKGFRYYLPAFMSCGLRNWNSELGRVADSCVFHLLHEPQKSLRASGPASVAAKYNFNRAQCSAIAHFLRFVIGPDDASSTEPRPTLEAVAKWERFVELS